MSEYETTVKWARDGTNFGDKNYSRDHVWLFKNSIELPASAAPAYLGDPNRVDPESAFVAALSWLHDKAHRECFIASSVTTKINVVPTE